MQRFRKLALLGLLIVILGSLAACGSSSSSSNGPKSLLSNIKSSGELRVGFASAQPWQMVDPKTGQWEGVYVNVMADWAKTLNVKFVPVFDNLG